MSIVELYQTSRESQSVTSAQRGAMPAPSDSTGEGCTYKASMSAEWAGVNRLQHAVFLTVDARNAIARWFAPSEEDHAAGAHASHGVNGLLGEPFPPFVRMAISLVGANGQAGVEHQNTSFSPWGKKTAFVGRWLEGGIVNLDATVNIDQRWRGLRRGPDGEG